MDTHGAKESAPSPGPVDDLLVRGVTWVDGTRRDVLVEGGRIAAVRAAGGSTTVEPSVPVLSAEGLIAIPGFVDAHCHLDKTLFAAAWEPHVAEDSLESRIATDLRRRGELGLPDSVSIRALLEHMSSTGTSLVRTHTDVDPGVGLDGVHRVHEVTTEMSRLITVQQVAFPQHGLHSNPGTVDLLAAALSEGASVVGGLDPTSDGDAVAYLDTLFDIADARTAGVDLHLHTRGGPGVDELDLVIERTASLDLGGRVVVSHAYVFADLDPDETRRLCDRLAEAGIAVVTAAPYSFPVPPIRELVAAGVVVGCGHDGIRDLWGPFGTGDMLDRTRHIASRSGYRRDADLELVLWAATTGGRRIVLGESIDPAPGSPVDLVLVPASCVAEAVATVPPRRVILRGPPEPAPGTVVTGVTS